MKTQTASITSVLSAINSTTTDEANNRAATLRDAALSTANPAQQQQIIQAWKTGTSNFYQSFASREKKV